MTTEATVDEFPFAANALRRAEGTTYQAPYLTPWTRTRRKSWLEREMEEVERRIERRSVASQKRFTAGSIAEIKRLYGVEGKTQRQIAILFNCSQKTVWWHVRDIERATAA